MKLVTYNLPSAWASALVNGDNSGLSDEDEYYLNEWFNETFPHGANCLSCSDEDDSPGFLRWHDAWRHVGAADCLTFTFDVSK